MLNVNKTMVILTFLITQNRLIYFHLCICPYDKTSRVLFLSWRFQSKSVYNWTRTHRPNPLGNVLAILTHYLDSTKPILLLFLHLVQLYPTIYHHLASSLNQQSYLISWGSARAIISICFLSLYIYI